MNYFQNPETPRQQKIREATNEIINYMDDGYSVTAAAKKAGINFNQPGNRMKILSDDLFYDRYLEFMFSRGVHNHLIDKEAVDRRGLEAVLELKIKYAKQREDQRRNRPFG